MARILLTALAAANPTLTPIETAFNALMATGLTSIVKAFNLITTDQAPATTRFGRLIVDTDNGGTLMTAPYQLKGFQADNEQTAISLVASFIAANPTYFISPTFYHYSDQLRGQSDRVMLFVVYNADATGGAANWQVGGGGGGSISAVNTGNVLWVDAVFGNDATALPDRFDLPYLTVDAAITAAVAGDLVWVRPGAYTATAAISKNGVSVWADRGVNISYNTTLIGPLGSGETFSLTGYADFTATGITARFISLTGGTAPTVQLDFNRHITSVANDNTCIFMDAAAVLRMSCLSFAANGGTALWSAGNSWSTGGGTFEMEVFDNITQNGAGVCFRLRQNTGFFSVKCSRLIATANAAIDNTNSASGSICRFQALTITGTTSAISFTQPATLELSVGSITASAGPAIQLTAAATVRAVVAGGVTGTTFGVSMSSGTVNLTCGALTASAGPAVSATGGTCTVTAQNNITGTTNALSVAGGTVIATSDSMTASAGPAVTISSGTVQTNVTRSMTGTSQVVSVPGGTATIRAGSTAASAGPSFLVSAGTLIADIVGACTGTGSVVTLTGSGTITLTARALTASAGAAIAIGSTAVGGNSFIVSGAITGTTSGVSNASTTGTAVNIYRATVITASNGPGVLQTACTHTDDFAGTRIQSTLANEPAIRRNTATGTGGLRLRSVALVAGAGGAASITTSTAGAEALLYGNGSSANVAVAGTITQVGGALVVNAALN